MGGIVEIAIKKFYGTVAMASAVPDPIEARKRLVALVNRQLADPGLRIAKSEENTPRDTGELIRSIRVVPAQTVGNAVTGALLVGVDYGKYQELKHHSKADYLKRAAEEVMRRIREDMEGDLILERLGARAIGRRE